MSLVEAKARAGCLHFENCPACHQQHLLSRFTVRGLRGLRGLLAVRPKRSCNTSAVRHRRKRGLLEGWPRREQNTASTATLACTFPSDGSRALERCPFSSASGRLGNYGWRHILRPLWDYSFQCVCTPTYAPDDYFFGKIRRVGKTAALTRELLSNARRYK